MKENNDIWQPRISHSVEHILVTSWETERRMTRIFHYFPFSLSLSLFLSHLSVFVSLFLSFCVCACVCVYAYKSVLLCILPLCVCVWAYLYIHMSVCASVHMGGIRVRDPSCLKTAGGDRKNGHWRSILTKTEGERAHTWWDWSSNIWNRHSDHPQLFH